LIAHKDVLKQRQENVFALIVNQLTEDKQMGDMFDRQGRYISRVRLLENKNVWGEDVKPKPKLPCDDVPNWLGNESCINCPERNIYPCKDDEEE
jgi:hypothetical protein